MTDPTATFRELYPRVLARTIRRTDQREDAEEATAEAFAIWLRRRPELSDKSETLRWLTVVARHELYRLAAKRRDELPSSHSAPVPGSHPPTVLELAVGGCGDEAQHELQELLDVLPTLTPGRQVGLICKLLGLSYEQAQEATGRTYTWLNRGITEGRTAARKAVAA